MALIFEDVSLDGRHLRDLMTVRVACCFYLLDWPRQAIPAVLALLRQHGPNLIDSLGWHHRPVRSPMTRLPAHLPLRGSQRLLNIQIAKCFGLCPLLFSECRSPAT